MFGFVLCLHAMGCSCMVLCMRHVADKSLSSAVTKRPQAGPCMPFPSSPLGLQDLGLLLSSV